MSERIGEQRQPPPHVLADLVFERRAGFPRVSDRGLRRYIRDDEIETQAAAIRACVHVASAAALGGLRTRPPGARFVRGRRPTATSSTICEELRAQRFDVHALTAALRAL